MKKNITKTKGYREAVETAKYFMRISEAIYQARNKKGLSQMDLAKGAKTTQRIISMIENDDDYNMGADLLYRIFKFLDLEMVVDNKDLISGNDKNYTINISTTANMRKTYNYSNESAEFYNIDKKKISALTVSIYNKL